MLLPSGNKVTKHTPLYPGSNFTWGEATKNCTRPIQALIIDGRLIKSDRQIERKIIEAAKELDQFRTILGNRPLWVNSWYRPKHINLSVGGSKWSRHQFGDAIDIRSNYYSPQFLYKTLNKLHLNGGLGRYYSFVHIDFRGTIARWHA